MSTASPAQAFLHRHVRVRLGGLLALPMAWLVLLYLLPLGLLLLTAFWSTDSFTGRLVREPTLDNVLDVVTSPTYLLVALRTVGVAAGVTAACALLGLPMACAMVFVVPARHRPLLLALVTTPLWASYLVKVYAWRTILAPGGGLADTVLGAVGLGSPGYGWGAVAATLTYLWLPYMVLPLYAGLASLRGSFLDAAADLGARPWLAFRTVVLPLLVPSLVAGSVFTFSLSLGDYITVQLVGGTEQMLGNVVYASSSVDLPFAAAVALLPVLIMAGYLTAARRAGGLADVR